MAATVKRRGLEDAAQVGQEGEPVLGIAADEERRRALFDELDDGLLRLAGEGGDRAGLAVAGHAVVGSHDHDHIR
jgi:hypothetical protein